MLNYQKIHTMTKLALFEESRAGKEALKISKYYKRDYVRYEMLKTFVSVTIGYGLILAMILIYQSEYIIENAVKLDYIGIGKIVIGVYLILLVIYLLASFIGYSIKYNKEHKKLRWYYKHLKRLRQIYKEEEAKQEVYTK